MIELSDHGTRDVGLKRFGEELCFVPEGTISPRAAAERMFPDFKVEYSERFASHGVWFIVSADTKAKTANVYPVKQTALRWSVPEDAFPPVYCRSSVVIRFRGSIPELDAAERR